MFHWIRILGLLLPLAGFAALTRVSPSTAQANACDDCKDQCRKGVDKCKKAGPKALCKGPAKIVCNMFKNFQCPAAGTICRKTRCGLGSCNPPSGPKGGNMSGDPHIYSLDRMRFDFQAVGEFWASSSEKADIEIQVRLKAYGPRASVVHMVAIRSGDHRVIFEAGSTLLVDDQSILLEEGTLYLSDSISLTQMDKGKILMQVGENNIWVHPRSSHINYYLEPHSSTLASWKGMMGDFNGKPENDFQNREGKVFERSEMTKEVLYGEFGESWRLSQAESFLLYRDGETTETFTEKAHPKEHGSIAGLDKETFDRARAACVAKGVRQGEALRNCIYDVGVAGTEIFVEGYQDALEVEAQAALQYPGALGIQIQASSHQGDLIPLFWSGALDSQVRYTLHTEDDKKIGSGRGRGENPIMVRLPAEVGSYTLKVAQGKAEIVRPIAATKAEATITVPDEVTGGKDFTVSFTGPIGVGDYVALTKKDEPKPSKYITYAWARRGPEAQFQAPASAGEYEIRYVLRGAGHSDRFILAKKVFKVTEAKATITPPKEISVGGHFFVGWTGPAGGHDFIDLSVPNNPKPSGYVTYAWARNSEEGKVKLRGPADPGEYEVRYVVNGSSGRSVIARAKVVAKDVQADMTFPASVPANEKFDITWEGPIDGHNFIGIGPPEAKEGTGHVHYVWATKKLKGKMRAPTKPGVYEVRYVLSGADRRRVIKKKMITVRAK